MNERIREIADEAAKYSAIMALPTGESGNELFLGKFAELIVRECADYVACGEFGDSGLAEELKKHFGVE